MAQALRRQISYNGLMGHRCLNKRLVKLPQVETDPVAMFVACGECVNCRKRRTAEWALRMILEAQSHAHAHFLTLTYCETSVPEKLDYSHISAFLKRFRKNSLQSVRFFCVGEYGKKTHRPHWHMILYCGQPLFPNGLCSVPEWPHGGVFVGNVTRASMEYVGRYSMKDSRSKTEYVVRTSRRPGLGAQALREYGNLLARSVPVLETEPFYINIGKRYYPLDKTARRYLIDGYVEAGGLLEKEETNPIRYDVIAPFERFMGDPASRIYSQSQSQLEYRRSFEDETF